MEPIVYTPKQAAALLDVSPSTIYRWMDAGEIYYVKMGKDAHRLIPKVPFHAKFGAESAS